MPEPEKQESQPTVSEAIAQKMHDIDSRNEAIGEPTPEEAKRIAAILARVK